MPIKPGKNCEYAIWFFPKKLSLQPVSEQEINWSNKFSPKRSREFLYSRGYIRKCISELFCIDRKSVPIFAPPGRPPKLKNGFGTILAIDAIHPSDNTESINIGTEFNYNNIGFIRFGYRNLFKRDLEQKLSIGCGIALNYRNIKYHIDYSYTDFEILGSPQKITITFVLR